MGYYLKKSFDASWLASNLKLQLLGHDRSISCISQYDDAEENALIFINDRSKLVSVSCSNCLIIAPVNGDNLDSHSILTSNHPRLDFIKALQLLSEQVGFQETSRELTIDESVVYGKNVVIEAGVQIGSNTKIGHNVVIKSGTVIGNNCVIQSGAVIGEDGCGYERDPMTSVLYKMAHFGGVQIGDDVLIGANTTIDQGSFQPTKIDDGVKVDNLVHIAHNCHIKKNALILACAEISGGVVVDESVWVAPNAAVRQKLSIGAHSLVGLGAVVVKDVEKNATVLGNPARRLK